MNQRKIVLLGLDFALSNLGCGALAYSFVNEISEVANAMGIDLEFTAVVYVPSEEIYVPCTGKKINCIKVKYKSFSFWKQFIRSINHSDIVVDFTGGDSFSDIYGKARFYKTSVLKIMAVFSKAKFVLGPQTYGPYKDGLVRRVAAWIIRKSDYVFSRDAVSAELVKKMTNKDAVITTDVAFALPYNHTDNLVEGKVNIGFNPSGLLWNGGYEFAKLNLQTDYHEYCRTVIRELVKDERNIVYLLPHVGLSSGEGNESDYTVCELLHKEFPNTVIVQGLKTPMDAKSVISTMNVFIGARMHATIGAFSSGVPTIPFSYSRKFEGLYNSLGYDKVIHACTESTENAIQKTLKLVDEREELKKEVDHALVRANELRNGFKTKLREILEDTN